MERHAVFYKRSRNEAVTRRLAGCTKEQETLSGDQGLFAESVVLRELTQVPVYVCFGEHYPKIHRNNRMQALSQRRQRLRPMFAVVHLHQLFI